MRDILRKNRYARLIAPVAWVWIILALWFLAGNHTAAPVMASEAADSEQYIVLAWNDLGMHCYNADYQYMAVLPPYNSLYAQVIRLGNPPEIITAGITLTYEFVDNSYSIGKSNFWDYDLDLFGVDLPDNVGLAGKGMTGTLDLHDDAWIAEGIPVTEFRDSDFEADPINPEPYRYQLAVVKVYDAITNELLAETTTVAPVSTEMDCENCHYDGYVDDVATGNVELNILTLHDQRNHNKYPSEHPGYLVNTTPVLCAECHASAALGEEGIRGIDSLSNVMHDTHKLRIWVVQPPLKGCYQCHPGPETQCLRDVMSQNYDMDCIDCHGTIYDVANKANPWLDEPRCDNTGCHDDGLHNQNQDLYRLSSNHGGVYCAGCHDSPHAIAPSRESNDAIKFIDLQSANDVIGFGSRCYVCHTGITMGTGPHDTTAQYLVLPLVIRQ